jgi:hypothetical protein
MTNPSETNEIVIPVEKSPEEKEAEAKITQIDAVIDFVGLPKHAVIVLKVGGDAMHKMRIHQAFVRFFKSKQSILKEKELTILFLEPGDGLEVLTEEDMDKAGWQKKEKSLIVKPF